MRFQVAITFPDLGRPPPLHDQLHFSAECLKVHRMGGAQAPL